MLVNLLLYRKHKLVYDQFVTLKASVFGAAQGTELAKLLAERLARQNRRGIDEVAFVGVKGDPRYAYVATTDGLSWGVMDLRALATEGVAGQEVA